MIAGIEGILESRGVDWVVVKVGGISLRICVSSFTLDCLGNVGEKIKLNTHLQVREDSLTLYGFASTAELELFTLLIGVDGVSPRVTLKMLSALSPEPLACAITSGDIETLNQLPGIGKKTAHRLVLELKEKLERQGEIEVLPSHTLDNADVVAALTSLGYSTREVMQAVVSLPDSPDLTLEERVKLALQYLSP